jgi:DNA-binding NtrC family response regulator
VDVRIIAATNRDLSEEVSRGRFRQDLYYRLEVVTIAIPALRDRIEDIAPLAEYFNQQLAAQLGVPPMPLEGETLRRLAAYPWPGNARELRNFIERSLILGYFPLEQFPERRAEPRDAAPTFDLSLTLDEVEKRHILRVLADVNGNKSEAARRLQVSRKTLERKCALWGE